MLEISQQNGFRAFDCDSGISSNVLEKDGYLYKINTRNSLQRAVSDYEELKRIFKNLGFKHKLQESEIFECVRDGIVAVCVKQKILAGRTIARVGKEQFKLFLKKNPKDLYFLKLIISVFFTRVKLKRLYPDLVGNPQDQSLFNSINLMLRQPDGLLLCDVGLSPHEETLKAVGEDFFNSANVTHYWYKMTEALRWLDGIS